MHAQGHPQRVNIETEGCGGKGFHLTSELLKGAFFSHDPVSALCEKPCVFVKDAKEDVCFAWVFVKDVKKTMCFCERRKGRRLFCLGFCERRKENHVFL